MNRTERNDHPPETSRPPVAGGRLLDGVRTPDLSLVVPVWNEAENIASLLAEIDAALGEVVAHEILYVDDGSTDATAERLAQAQARYPRLRVLHHAARCGQSTALMTGVRAARAEWIVTLDGDGQNDPADIPRLLAVLRDPAQPKNLELVGGHRRRRRDSWVKRMSSRVANGVRSRVLGDGTPDTGCGLKIIRRSTYLELPFFDHMHRFLPALVQRAGGGTVSIEVNHRPRTRRVSNYGIRNRLWVGLVDMLGVLWLQRRMTHPVVLEGRRPADPSFMNRPR
jgi:dolichol-phosphate mannosyltransferase